MKLSGLIDWWFWLVASIFFLIGLRNRMVVLIDWAWAYWSYQRDALIIVDDRTKAPLPTPPMDNN